MRQCPILMYHWFRQGGTPSASRSPQLEITPELFERQMTHLRRTGYRTVRLAEAFGDTAGTPLAGRPIVISFDDGTLDFLEHAHPALARHGFTATLFVVTAHVGGESTWDRALGEPARPLLSWEQILELRDAGHEIGSHTHTHRPLTDLSDHEARDELERSRDVLAERLGEMPEYLAYPRGFYAGRHKRLVSGAGYSGACAVILRWGDLARADRFELKRMTIKGNESMLRFRMRLWLCRMVRYRSHGTPA